MFFLLSLLLGDERATELDRVWNHRAPTEPLQVWSNYKRDENGVESGECVVVQGRKYQQLQGPRLKGVDTGR